MKKELTSSGKINCVPLTCIPYSKDYMCMYVKARMLSRAFSLE